MMEDAAIADTSMMNVQRIAEEGLPHQNRPQDVTGEATELEQELLKAAPTAENVQNRMVTSQAPNNQMLPAAVPQRYQHRKLKQR